tara:strand:+ start:7094 stop:7969 length:876 start_codon:yes stop_codon:yes gene_type:complete
MNNYKKPYLIAEIGCNHMGQLEIAKDLINLAKMSGASVAKFQKRDNINLLSKKQYDSPHPNPNNSYGKTYGEHREFLEFSIDIHKDLKLYCEEVGINYATSVWDIISAREVISLEPKFIKIPSACNNNEELLQVLRDEYQGEVHISVGMTNKLEEENIISLFENNKSAKERLVIYSCTSGYPVPFKDICLLEISRLQEEYGDRVKNIGFSGHHLGIAVDIAAFTLGANIIERHFTKDRTWKGTDHAASLEPNGLLKLSRDLKAVYESLSYKEEEILEIEKEQRLKLKFKSN